MNWMEQYYWRLVHGKWLKNKGSSLGLYKTQALFLFSQTFVWIFLTLKCSGIRILFLTIYFLTKEMAQIEFSVLESKMINNILQFFTVFEIF